MSSRTPAELSVQILRSLCVTARSEATLEAGRWARHLESGRAWEVDLQDLPSEREIEPLAGTPGELSRSLVRVLMQGGVAVDQMPSLPAIPGLDVIELPGLEWLDPPLDQGSLPLPEGAPE